MLGTAKFQTIRRFDSWIVLVCGLLLTCVFSCFAYISDLEGIKVNTLKWLSDNRNILIVADEVSMFASILLLAVAILLYRKLKCSNIAMIGLASWSVAAIGLVSVVLFAGRTIYPVNSIEVLSYSVIPNVASAFAGLHLTSIGLGIGMLAFGYGFRKFIPFWFSVLSGCMHIAGTYYAKHPAVWILTVSCIVIVCWFIAVSYTLRKM